MGERATGRRAPRRTFLLVRRLRWLSAAYAARRRGRAHVQRARPRRARRRPRQGHRRRYRPRSMPPPARAAPCPFRPATMCPARCGCAAAHPSPRRGRDAVASRDDGDFDPLEAPGYETFADRETQRLTRSPSCRGEACGRSPSWGRAGSTAARSSREGPKPIALRECRDVRIHGHRASPMRATTTSACSAATTSTSPDVTIENGYADGIDSRLLSERAHHRLPYRVARRRHRAEDEPGARTAAGHRGVTVSGCHLVTLHNGLKLGTESSGDFRRITFRDCSIVGRRHAWKGELTGGVVLTSVDGGMLEDVTVSGIRMDRPCARPCSSGSAVAGVGRPCRRRGPCATSRSRT